MMNNDEQRVFSLDQSCLLIISNWRITITHSLVIPAIIYLLPITQPLNKQTQTQRN